MSEAKERAASEFARAKNRLTLLLEKTPGDRVNWSPSATCRTPLQQVAHSAIAMEGIHGMLTGKPFPYENISDMDSAIRSAEKEFTTREQVLSLLEKNSAAYLTWLEALSDDQLSTIIQGPMGPLPLAVAIGFPAMHTQAHAAQLEYIQTIYGDHNWYM